jgi:two-component SAPR family response regulator
MRDGLKAVEMAAKACELTQWKQSEMVDTLAAAYAEAGDFDEATTYEKQALRFDNLSEQKRKLMERRLALYEARQPNHNGQEQAY